MEVIWVVGQNLFLLTRAKISISKWLEDAIHGPHVEDES